MAKAILLSDTCAFSEIGFGRYMGAYAVASHARASQHSIVVIDYFTKHPHFFEYLENFLEADTAVVGISSTFLAPTPKDKTFSQRSEAVSDFFTGELWHQSGDELKAWVLKLKELLKKKTRRAQLVLGGVKSQYALWRPEYYSHFDYVFVGPADYAFTQLLNQIDMNITPPVKQMNGINFIDNTFDIENKFCPDARLTRQDAVLPNESLPLEVSRGCAFNCKFCHYNKQASFRKDVSTLKNELIRNYELFGTNTYSFCDDCFNDHPKKVSDYCEMFLSLPFSIEWVAYARVDVAVKYPWSIDLMIKSGARGLYWGIESFDHEVARRAGKGTSPEKVKELLHRLYNEHRDNCITEISLITGLPGETNESLERGLNWLLANPVVDILSIGSLGLTPYVETLDKKLFDYADYSRNPQKYGFKEVRFKPDYWAHDTMDLPNAREWATRYQNEFRLVKKRRPFRTVWLYPHLKTLGFTKSEIFKMYKSNDELPVSTDKIKLRFQSHLERYWHTLLINNRPALSQQDYSQPSSLLL